MSNIGGEGCFFLRESIPGGENHFYLIDRAKAMNGYRTKRLHNWLYDRYGRTKCMTNMAKELLSEAKCLNLALMPCQARWANSKLEWISIKKEDICIQDSMTFGFKFQGPMCLPIIGSNFSCFVMNLAP